MKIRPCVFVQELNVHFQFRQLLNQVLEGQENKKLKIKTWLLLLTYQPTAVGVYKKRPWQVLSCLLPANLYWLTHKHCFKNHWNQQLIELTLHILCNVL